MGRPSKATQAKAAKATTAKPVTAADEDIAICAPCFPDGWPDGATAVGCEHGSWALDQPAAVETPAEETADAEDETPALPLYTYAGDDPVNDQVWIELGALDDGTKLYTFAGDTPGEPATGASDTWHVYTPPAADA